MRNAFLGKVKLNQGNIIFRLKVINKTVGNIYTYMPPPSWKWG